MPPLLCDWILTALSRKSKNPEKRAFRVFFHRKKERFSTVSAIVTVFCRRFSIAFPQNIGLFSAREISENSFFTVFHTINIRKVRKKKNDIRGNDGKNFRTTCGCVFSEKGKGIFSTGFPQKKYAYLLFISLNKCRMFFSQFPPCLLRLKIK